MQMQRSVASVAASARAVTVRIADSLQMLFSSPDLFGDECSALESGLSTSN